MSPRKEHRAPAQDAHARRLGDRTVRFLSRQHKIPREAGAQCIQRGAERAHRGGHDAGDDQPAHAGGHLREDEIGKRLAAGDSLGQGGLARFVECRNEDSHEDE